MYYFDFANLSEDALRHAMAMYYGTISHIDDSVGQIVSLLKEKGLYEDTMIIYTADHGDYMGFHHLLLKGGAMYDPLMKIPLIVKPARGSINRGRVQSLTSTVDIPSMVLAQCGIEPHPVMASAPRGDYVFAECFNRTKNYMVRSSTHKLLVNGSMSNATLFDLQNDPHELCDISKEPESQDIIDRMQARLLEEFFFARRRAHLDLNAPVIRAASAEEAQEMSDYMQNHSSMAFVSRNA